jgi:succinate dehydrogenase/fumarate reductase flavoprotein subunit
MDNGKFDLVIVGGGLAGMVAGARAAELGLSAAVLEKGTDPRYPCNTRWSGGILHVAYTDPKEGEASLRAAIEQSTRGFTDPALADVMVRETARAIDWLRAQGGRFVRAGRVAWQNWMMAPPRPLVAGLDWQGRGPDVMLRLLADRLREGGGRLVLGARALRLLLREDACAGVEAEISGAAQRLEAPSVVLADGGFQADFALLREHVMPVPEEVKQRCASTGAGDGLRMAREAGAALTPLDCFYGHLLCRDSMVSDRVWPYPELDGIAAAGIVVDPSGARILDEGRGGIAMANRIARSSQPLSASVVFDAAIWEGPGRSARIPANPELARAGGTIHRAPTLGDLARLAGIDREGLERTVALYNAACGSGRLALLAPPRSSDRYQPMPIASAPFLAIPACAGITYTMGGIRIDGDARVLRPDGSAIPGLYAAGATTGGIEGGPFIGYVGGLSKAAVFGLRAAEHAAATARGVRP